MGLSYLLLGLQPCSIMTTEKVEEKLPTASPGRTKQGWGAMSLIAEKMWANDLNI